MGYKKHTKATMRSDARVRMDENQTIKTSGLIKTAINELTIK